MAEVNLEKIIEEQKRKEAEKSAIEAKSIGDATFFKGRLLDKWYSDYGECVSANQAEANRLRNKELGLDEFGRTPEDAKRAEKINALLKDRMKIVEDLRKLDVEIAKARTEKVVIEEKKPVVKKGK